jgi:hypothetical protein
MAPGNDISPGDASWTRYGIYQVQNGTGSRTHLQGTPVTANWPNATTAGNCLFGIIGSDTAITPTAATGFTLVSSFQEATFDSIYFYDAVNASSQSGSTSWAYTPGSIGVTLIILEYHGLATTTPQDGTTQTGGSTTGATSFTGPSITTTNANDLILTVFCGTATGATGPVYSHSASDGFVIRQQINVEYLTTPTATWNVLCVCESIVSSTGTYNCSVTSNVTIASYAAMTLAFKGTVGPPPPTTAFRKTRSELGTRTGSRQRAAA